MSALLSQMDTVNMDTRHGLSHWASSRDNHLGEPSSPIQHGVNMIETFTYFNDPGHGWLAVSVERLAELGIAHEISSFSYEKGGVAYLEEDCDAGVFMKAYVKQHGKRPLIDEVYQEVTPIRNYQCYVPTKHA